MKRLLAVVLILICFLFTGCLQQIELTEEETEQIAQAAAGMLLNRDNNYTEKLATPTPVPTDVPIIMATSTPTPTSAAGSDNGETAPTGSVTPNQQANCELTDIIGIDSISLQYDGYEMYDSYTFGAFSVEPKVFGNRLMIVYILVRNSATEPIVVDLMDSSLEYRLDIDGGTRLVPQQSILLNDFQFLSTEIDAETDFSSVLVFEVKEDLNPETMNLFIMQEDKTVIIKLK